MQRAHEKALVERFKGKPFGIVGINGDTDNAAAMAAVSAHDINWRSFKDKGANKAISNEWRDLGWPTFYLIDHEGIIRHEWIDAPPGDELDIAVSRLVDAAMKVVDTEPN